MSTESTPEQIAMSMNGVLYQSQPDRFEALLPSTCVQNHAAFLSTQGDSLSCLWFGGSLEGKADISIWQSTLHKDRWSTAVRLSDDAYRSEQNPLLFHSPDGRELLLHTAQHGGKQDRCTVRMRERGGKPRDLPLPAGTFIRSPIHVRSNGDWLLPVFHCVQRSAQQWNGSYDYAAVAISADAGTHWREVKIPDSIGCVHTTLVALDKQRYIALFRRRQADYVYRSESQDAGESWSKPTPTNVPNNNSSIAAIKLLDGRVALLCNPTNAAAHPDARRVSLYDELNERDERPQASDGCNPVWGVPRSPLTLCLSDNEGRSFTQRLTIASSPGSCLTNNSVDGNNKELSYPSLLQHADGTLDLAFTCYRRAIKHIRLTAAAYLT